MLRRKRTPGEKLHKRVSNLARMGSLSAINGCYGAGFTVSPTIETRAVFQPSSGDVVLVRIEKVPTPTGEEKIISYFEINPNGNTRRFNVINGREAKSLLAKYDFDLSTNMEFIFQELLELGKRERDAKSEMGIIDWLDDGEIGELLGLVKSKTLRCISR